MKHLDEARSEATKTLRTLLGQYPEIEKAVLIADLFGKLRVVFWAPREKSEEVRRKIDDALRNEAVAGRYWTGEIWKASIAENEADRLVCERAWGEGSEVEGIARLRRTDRHRSRGSWFTKFREPPWLAPVAGSSTGPPIVIYYSFKGGVGRSTALASFAIQRARLGERVAIIDFDLDAPGVGSLLAADDAGTTASWGVVDYLVERPLGMVDLRDYYHVCRREAVTGPGEILVVPAGHLDGEYLNKLGRVDFEVTAGGEEEHPVLTLMDELRMELQPHWLLFDARAGLSEPAGLLLRGLAHLHVLFGTVSEQSWHGLRLVLQRLGAERVRSDHQQSECLLIQAMVPSDATVAAMAAFADRARDEFTDHYYAEDPENPEEDRFWYVRDLEDEDAPHVPVPLPYESKLANFRRIDEVASLLAETAGYKVLAQRIAARFVEGEE